MTQGGATRFQRLVLPGFALKAVVIGGGYATGRELAEFFLPEWPLGRSGRHAAGHRDLERSVHRDVSAGAGIAFFTAFGSSSVERLFKWGSIFLYIVYGLFLLLGLAGFGGPIVEHFSKPAPTDGWAIGGVTYAAYNIVGAVIILPVIRSRG